MLSCSIYFTGKDNHDKITEVSLLQDINCAREVPNTNPRASRVIFRSKFDIQQTAVCISCHIEINATTEVESTKFSPNLNREPHSKVYILPMVLSSKAAMRILCVSDIFFLTFK